MPRLSNTPYYVLHGALHTLWIEHRGGPLRYLTPAEQWTLHDYFRLSEDLTDAELLEHRNLITKKRPSLPHAAGRAIKKLCGPFPVPGRGGGGAGPKRVVIYPLVRPKIDYDKFAHALLKLAEQQLRDIDADDSAMAGR